MFPLHRFQALTSWTPRGLQGSNSVRKYSNIPTSSPSEFRDSPFSSSETSNRVSQLRTRILTLSISLKSLSTTTRASLMTQTSTLQSLHSTTVSTLLDRKKSILRSSGPFHRTSQPVNRWMSLSSDLTDPFSTSRTGRTLRKLTRRSDRKSHLRQSPVESLMPSKGRVTHCKSCPRRLWPPTLS